jgi:hypothetical protein
MNIFWKKKRFRRVCSALRGIGCKVWCPGANDVAELTTSGATVTADFGVTTVLGLNLVSTGFLGENGFLTATEGTAAAPTAAP